MNVDVLCRPAATVARLEMAQGEQITCEVGAMVAMSPGLTVDTSSHKRGQAASLRGLNGCLPVRTSF